MENVYGTKASNQILRKQFSRGEFSYALSDLTKALGPMIDLIFIGYYIGPDGLSVISYISPLIILYELVGNILGNGSRAKVSYLIGAGKIDEANQVFTTSSVLGFAVSALMSLLTIIFLPVVVFLLGVREPQWIAMTKSYLIGYAIGVPYYTMTRILKMYLEMDGRYLRLNIAYILTTVIDVIGDALVIFFFNKSMLGIGLATSVGYIIPFIIIGMYFVHSKTPSMFRISLKNFKYPIIVDILKMGASSGFIKGSRSVGGIIINNLLTDTGVPYLVASYGVFSQITTFVRSSWFAPSDTMFSFIGVFIGEEDRQSIKELQALSLSRSLIYSCVTALLLFLLSPFLSRGLMHTSDMAAVTMCTECIRISCLSIPFNAVVHNFNYQLTAVKKILFACIYSFLMECGNLVPITYILLKLIDYRGAYIAIIANGLIISSVAVIYIMFSRHGKNFREKMLLLPDSFGIPDDRRMAVVAKTPEEIRKLSRIAIAFAMENGSDSRKARSIGLIIEELSGLFLEYAPEDRKSHNINLTMVAKGDDFIIRMYNDYARFNIKDYSETLNNSKVSEDLSLKIVMKLAKEVNYATIFGVNSLTVTV